MKKLFFAFALLAVAACGTQNQQSTTKALDAKSLKIIQPDFAEEDYLYFGQLARTPGLGYILPVDYSFAGKCEKYSKLSLEGNKVYCAATDGTRYQFATLTDKTVLEEPFGVPSLAYSFVSEQNVTVTFDEISFKAVIVVR